MDLIWCIYGLKTPEKEFRFEASRRWRFDYAWRDQRIAVEIEGAIWTRGRHTRGSGYLRDMEKYNHAAKLGWRTFRFTPDQLKKGEAQAYMKEIFDSLS